MSDKVWVTAKSEFIPFEKLTDKHLENAIAWCDIRIQSIDRTPRDPRTNFAVQREWARVKDLKTDLLHEADRRKRLDVRVLDVQFNFPARVNGNFVAPFAHHRIQLARGEQVTVKREG